MPFSADDARRILALDLNEAVHARVALLSTRASRGELTEPQAKELNAMLEVSDLLIELKARARIHLRKRGDSEEP